MELSTGAMTPTGTWVGAAAPLPVGWSEQAARASPPASAATTRPRGRERYCMVWCSRVGRWDGTRGDRSDPGGLPHLKRRREVVLHEPYLKRCDTVKAARKRLFFT